MPHSPDSLARSIGLTVTSSFPWGKVGCSEKPGIYMVSQSSDRDAIVAAKTPAFDLSLIEKWISRVQQMRLDGEKCTAKAVAQFLATFWHPAETIVYIGQSKEMSSRLDEYFTHTLGNRSPHKGGHWLKALLNLRSMHVHCVECADPKGSEKRAIEIFQADVIGARPELECHPILAIPFANRRFGKVKQNRLTNEVLPKA